MRQSGLSLKNCFQLSKQTRPPLGTPIDDAGNISSVEDIAERLKDEVRSPLLVLGHKIFVTMSIGIIFSDTADFKQSDELLLQKKCGSHAKRFIFSIEDGSTVVRSLAFCQYPHFPAQAEKRVNQTR